MLSDPVNVVCSIVRETWWRSTLVYRVVVSSTVFQESHLNPMSHGILLCLACRSVSRLVTLCPTVPRRNIVFHKVVAKRYPVISHKQCLVGPHCVRQFPCVCYRVPSRPMESLGVFSCVPVHHDTFWHCTAVYQSVAKRLAVSQTFMVP